MTPAKKHLYGNPARRVELGRKGEFAVPLGEPAEIIVQSEWNGWRNARVRLSDLEEIHWLQPTGAPRPLIHAYVRCNKFVSGNLPHDCSIASRPHHLRVCVLKCHTTPRTFESLSLRATERVGWLNAPGRNIRDVHGDMA